MINPKNKLNSKIKSSNIYQILVRAASNCDSLENIVLRAIENAECANLELSYDLISSFINAQTLVRSAIHLRS